MIDRRDGPQPSLGQRGPKNSADPANSAWGFLFTQRSQSSQRFFSAPPRLRVNKFSHAETRRTRRVLEQLIRFPTHRKFATEKTMNILSIYTCQTNLYSTVNLYSFLRVCRHISLRLCASTRTINFAQRRKGAERLMMHFLHSTAARFRLAKGMIMIPKYPAMKNPLQGVNFPSFWRVCG